MHRACHAGLHSQKCTVSEPSAGQPGPNSGDFDKGPATARNERWRRRPSLKGTSPSESRPRQILCYIQAPQLELDATWARLWPRRQQLSKSATRPVRKQMPEPKAQESETRKCKSRTRWKRTLTHSVWAYDHYYFGARYLGPGKRFF